MSDQQAIFDIRNWIPYKLWRLSLEAGFLLEEYYSDKYSIKRESWQFLAMIACSAPISAKELGERLDMDQVQVTRTLQKVLHKGYIDRSTDPSDRRKAVLTLTNKGAAVYKNIQKKANELEKNMFDGLPKEEQAAFVNTVDRLASNIANLKE